MLKGNANKKLREFFDNNCHHFDNNLRGKFKDLANEIDSLFKDKALSKLVSKINKAD